MSDVIAAMATLPVVFRQGEDSAVAIASRSGFAEHRGAITVREIADFLDKHPTLVDSWWLWSMDKRTDRAGSSRNAPFAFLGNRGGSSDISCARKVAHGGTFATRPRRVPRSSSVSLST